MFLSANVAFCFALAYAGLGKWLTRRTLTLLSIPISIFTLLTLTEDAHPLIWFGFWADSRVHVSLTVWAIAFFAYGMLLLFLNTVVFFGLFLRSPLHRWPIGAIVLGGLAPRLFTPLQMLDLIGYATLDPVTFSYNFTGLTFALALFRFHMFNLIPVARETVIEQMRDGMLVVDAQDRLAELNRAAEAFLGAGAAQLVGNDVTQVLRASPGLLQVLGEPDAEGPVEVEAGGAHVCYEVRVSRLSDERGLPLGRLVLLHDVTERKRAQEQLLQQQRALAVLRERARVARDLHDGLGQVLGYAKLQAQAARELLARGQADTADDYLDHLIGVTRESHADMQDYTLDTRRAAAPELGLRDSLEQFLHRFRENYGIAAQLIAPPDWTDGAVDPEVRIQLLRIVQEALSNTRKHAHANSVRVSLDDGDDQLRILIEDDGVGFDQLAAGDRSSFGLRFMRERATDVRGSVQVHSAPGKGTRVLVRAPLRKEPQ